MAIKKSISVWLIITDGINKGKIPLQKRSSSEKNFPLTCQATWSGKVEEYEDVMTAVKRECQEEMGDEFYNIFDFNSLAELEKDEIIYKGEVWERYNYMMEISEKDLSLTRLHGDAFPEFIFVDEKTIFYPLSAEKSPEDSIVLFDDQYKVLCRIIKK